jgi:hypothetical protein
MAVYVAVWGQDNNTIDIRISLIATGMVTLVIREAAKAASPETK